MRGNYLHDMKDMRMKLSQRRNGLALNDKFAL